MIRKKVYCLLLGILLYTQGIYPTEDLGVGVTRVVPSMLRRPDRGEAPRFPRDLVIGELGRGEAPIEAYEMARNSLSVLTRGLRDTPIQGNANNAINSRHFEEIAGIRSRDFRLGGGRIEPDGTVSFLVRFLGPEDTISGELYLRLRDEFDTGGTGMWILDDLILEDNRPLREIGDSYRFDFTPYERFF